MSTRRHYVSAQREEAARETRARVLAAAKDELIRHGFHATTVSSLLRSTRSAG